MFLGSFVLVFTYLISSQKRAGGNLLAVSAWCGIVSIGAYAVINILNINRVGMLWHDEANILSIAAAYTRGQQMYHPISSPFYYSLFYGPSTFLVFAPFLAFFRRPIIAIRLGIFAVNLLNLSLLFTLLRTRLSRSASLAILPIGIAFLLAYPGVLLGNRGDIWLLLCLLLSIASVLKYRPLGWVYPTVICGLFGGLAIDFKATAAPAVCCVLVILYRRYGHRAAILSALLCIISAISIFCLPHIALPNYVGWLIISSHQRLLKSTCILNAFAGAFLLAPVVLIRIFGGSLRQLRRVDWVMTSCCGVALVVCIVTGAKDGGGGWHLWPVLPFALIGAAYEVSLRCENCRRQTALDLSTQRQYAIATSNKAFVVIASMALAGASTSMYFAMHDIRVVRPHADGTWRIKERTAQQALDGILSQSFPDRNLVMGYGTAVTDYRTDLRYELPLFGQDYYFDENSVVEGIKAGFPVPPRVTSRVLGCGSIWIIPHGEVPFSSIRTGVLPVTTTAYIFPDELRLHFSDEHVVFEQGGVFDLWKCSSGAINPSLTPIGSK